MNFINNFMKLIFNFVKLGILVLIGVVIYNWFSLEVETSDMTKEEKREYLKKETIKNDKIIKEELQRIKETKK